MRIQFCQYTIFMLLIACSGWALAEQLPASVDFSEKKINRKLASQFPLEKTYDGVTVVFSSAQADIDVLDKSVEITVQLKVTHNDQSLTAKGIFEGDLDYQSVDDTIVFDRPTLAHFYVQDDNMQDSSHAQKVVKQSMLAGYPDFILIDLSEYSLQSANNPPSEIEISVEMIRVHWNTDPSAGLL